MRTSVGVAELMSHAYNAVVTSTAKRILEVALALPEDDRRMLAEAILDSVPASEGFERTWVGEARRRAEEVERGEGELLDLERASNDLRADLRCA
jgi:hypothetical protein